jgi:hypothetical protein
MSPTGASEWSPDAIVVRCSNDNAKVQAEAGPCSAPAQSGVTRIAIAGPIEEGLIASLLQMWANAASCGVLEIASGAQEGAMELHYGRVVHARVGNLLGQAACFRILAFEAGEFRYRRADHPESHEPATPEQRRIARTEIQDLLFAWIQLVRR